MADYSLEKWCFGVSWRTIKRWRGVVANIIGRPEAVAVVLGPFPMRLPTLSGIVKPVKAVTVVADKPEAVAAVETRTSLALFRDYFASPTNIVSGCTAVSCAGVNRTGLTGYRSSSRLNGRGHGRYNRLPVLSQSRSEYWQAVADCVGPQAVADVLAVPVSDYRRLELLGSVLLAGKAVADVQRLERTRDGIGFADCCDRTIGTMQSHIIPIDEADSVLLRLIARQSACESDRLELAGKIEAVAESLKTGLSIAWKAGLTDIKAGELLAVTPRTIQNYRRKVVEAVSGFASVLPK